MYKSFLKCIKINTVHLINCTNVQSCNRVTVFLRLGLLSGKFFVFAVGARPVWRKQAKGSGVNALVPSAVSALAAPGSGFGARCPRRLLRSAAFSPRSAWLRCGGAGLLLVSHFVCLGSFGLCSGGGTMETRVD